MANNSVYLNVFNNLKIDITDELKNGNFTELNIERDKMIFNVTIQYPIVINVDSVALIRQRFNEFFYKEGQFKQINITFKYLDNSISDDMLLRYYNYIVNIFESKKPRYTILKPIHKGVMDGNVKLYVATSDEIETIQP